MTRLSHPLFLVLLQQLWHRAESRLAEPEPGGSAEPTQGHCLQSELLYHCTSYISEYEEICCQSPQRYAEPSGFLATKDISLFDRLERMMEEVKAGKSDSEVGAAAGVDPSHKPPFRSAAHIQWSNASQGYEVTFFDSQCGLPIFIAPRNRTFQEWKQASLNHGWPSFKTPEVVSENVEVLPGGEVVTKCPGGARTHLGHILPDNGGSHYCIDLMCISGYSVHEMTSNSAASPTVSTGGTVVS